MFIIDWVFDKVGYIPKINVQVGVLNKPWPFPSEVEIKNLSDKPLPIKKAVAKKPVAKKPVAKKATKVAKKAT
jgi:hypothetical protein